MSSVLASTRSPPARLAVLGLAALALLTATSATASADESATGTGAEAVAASPVVSLQFTRRTASLVGTRALVHVKCAGAAEEPCVGTLALRGAAGSHKVAYSIDGEEEQILVVPLGSSERAIGRLTTVRAVARTMQASGASVDTAKRLRVR